MAEIGKPKIIRPHNSEASAIVNVLGTEQVGIFAGSRNPGNLLAVALELKLCGIHKLLPCNVKYIKRFYKIKFLDKPSLQNNDCSSIFQVHPDSFCIVYDDEECKGHDGFKTFNSGEVIIEPPKTFDVESISVKKGCQITVNTGIYTAI